LDKFKGLPRFVVCQCAPIQAQTNKLSNNIQLSVRESQSALLLVQ
jgi:hypothetical protein